MSKSINLNSTLWVRRFKIVPRTIPQIFTLQLRAHAESQRRSEEGLPTHGVQRHREPNAVEGTGISPTQAQHTPVLGGAAKRGVRPHRMGTELDRTQDHTYEHLQTTGYVLKLRREKRKCHRVYSGQGMTPKELKSTCCNLRDPLAKKREIFEKKLLPRHPAVLGDWFRMTFPDAQVGK